MTAPMTIAVENSYIYTSYPSARAVDVIYDWLMKKKTMADWRCKRWSGKLYLRSDRATTHHHDTLEDEVAEPLEPEVLAESTLLIQLRKVHEDVVVEISVEDTTGRSEEKMKSVTVPSGHETERY
jgi:hypothetical protein